MTLFQNWILRITQLRLGFVTFIVCGKIQIQIPIVSGSISNPTGNTSGWLNASPKIKDLPSLQGPTIDTTHTGSRK